jgi:hypothetical protein
MRGHRGEAVERGQEPADLDLSGVAGGKLALVAQPDALTDAVLRGDPAKCSVGVQSSLAFVTGCSGMTAASICRRKSVGSAKL